MKNCKFFNDNIKAAAYYRFNGIKLCAVGKTENEAIENLQESVLEYKNKLSKDIEETFAEFNKAKEIEELKVELAKQMKGLDYIDKHLSHLKEEQEMIKEEKKDIKEEQKEILINRDKTLEKIRNLSSN